MMADYENVRLEVGGAAGQQLRLDTVRLRWLGRKLALAALGVAGKKNALGAEVEAHDDAVAVRVGIIFRVAVEEAHPRAVAERHGGSVHHRSLPHLEGAVASSEERLVGEEGVRGVV